MKYFKRKWNEARGDEFDHWGVSLFFIEIDDSGFPSRQIERYENGIVLKYSKNKIEDNYGGLGDQELDLKEFKEFEISQSDFEKEWNTKEKHFITSKSIGYLFQNAQFEDWWESELIEIPFFNNKKMKITFMDFIPESDTEFIKEADEALQLFLQKNESDRLLISNLVHKNCMDFLNAVEFDEADQPLWDIQNENEIWNYVQPNEIFIARRPYNDEDIYVDINCECNWEQEHGLQLVFRKGKKITRVSQIDGHLTDADSYDKPDSEDKLLSQFNNNNIKTEWWKFWK